VPRGVFGFAVAELLTNKSNDLKLKEDKIYRDQVSFHYGPYISEVKLMSFPTYIRIDVYPKSQTSYPNSTLCCKTKNAVETALKTVMSKLNYAEVSRHNASFFCSLCGTAHISSVELHEREWYLPCSLMEQSIPLPSELRIWMDQVRNRNV